MKGKHMKIITIIIPVAIALMSLTACSANEENSKVSETSSNYQESTSKYEESTSKYVESSYDTLSSNSYEMDLSSDDYEYETSSYKDLYISNRRVQYEESIGKNVLIWSLTEDRESSNYISLPATAFVRVVNNRGETVLDNAYEISVDDYHTGTNIYDPTPVLYCWLELDNEDFVKGSTDEGTLYFSLSTDYGNFDEYAIDVDNLPLKEISIKLPEVPITINNYNYEDTPEMILDIISVDVKYENNYDDSVTAKLTVKATMTYNVEGDKHSDTTSIGYKLKDSEGVVIDSGEMYLDPMCVGETVKDDMSFYDLDLNESYTIEFIDTD